MKHLNEYGEDLKKDDDPIVDTCTVYILQIEDHGFGELHLRKETFKKDEPELEDYLVDNDGDLTQAVMTYLKDPEAITHGHNSIVVPLNKEQYEQLKSTVRLMK